MSEQWIIFDAMGVIFEVGDDTNDLIIPYILRKNPSIEAQTVNAFYLLASSGKMSSQEFWKAVGLGDQYPTVEQDYLNTYPTIDPEFTKIARALSKDYSLALLSNDIGEWSKHLRARFDLEGLLKVAVVSGAVGLRKPDPKIYQLLLDKLKVPAKDCLFIDDRLQNLQPALQIGMQVILFERNTQSDQTDVQAISSFKELPAMVKNVMPVLS